MAVMRGKYFYPLCALLAFAGFLSAVVVRPAYQPAHRLPNQALERVVIAAPVLLVLSGGDRFLAADLEVMRLATTGVDLGEVDTDYLVRAQQVAAQLHPCHEDNYYLANGLLGWGGASETATHILRMAMNCRYWDFTPAFFYGFNQYFFNRDIPEAQAALVQAATRSPENAAALRKMAVMIEVEQISDEVLALNQLQRQRDATRDPKLKKMLDRRVVRLQGLVILRDAQRRFEEKTGQSLEKPQQLLASRVLDALPVDPLGLGYELKDGRFMLKQMKVIGAERPQ